MTAIVGHRGLPRRFPDNSAAGIEAAAGVCDMVEIDVRRTGDGVAVLSHDPEIDGEAVVSRDWRHWAGYDTGTGYSIARLDAVLALVGDTPLNLELKNMPDEPDFDPSFEFQLRVLETARPDDLITSFHWPTVEAVRAARPDLATGLLVSGREAGFEETVRAAAGGGHGAVAAFRLLMDPDPRAQVEQAHAAGLQVIVWTVNDPARAVSLARGGVDAIISDDPIGIRRAIEEGT